MFKRKCNGNVMEIYSIYDMNIKEYAVHDKNFWYYLLLMSVKLIRIINCIAKIAKNKTESMHLFIQDMNL